MAKTGLVLQLYAQYTKHTILIKKIVCMGVFLFVSNVLYGQNQSFNISMRDTADTSQIGSLIKQSKKIQFLRPDSALLLAENGLELARKISYKKGEGDCLNRLGVVLMQNG